MERKKVRWLLLLKCFVSVLVFYGLRVELFVEGII